MDERAGGNARRIVVILMLRCTLSFVYNVFPYVWTQDEKEKKEKQCPPCFPTFISPLSSALSSLVRVVGLLAALFGAVGSSNLQGN